MPFKSKEKLGGQIDPNINTKGLIPKEDKNKYTKKEIKEKELLALVRKLKPHLTVAVKTAVRIMKSEESKEADQLKAAALIMRLYKELLHDAYGIEEEEEGHDPEETAALFSFTQVNKD